MEEVGGVMSDEKVGVKVCMVPRYGRMPYSTRYHTRFVGTTTNNLFFYLQETEVSLSYF